jgi:hypothetical protein
MAAPRLVISLMQKAMNAIATGKGHWNAAIRAPDGVSIGCVQLMYFLKRRHPPRSDETKPPAEYDADGFATLGPDLGKFPVLIR